MPSCRSSRHPIGAGTLGRVPGFVHGHSESAGDATWLNIHVVKVTADNRPIVSDSPNGPTWGLHDYDVNLALGNLVQMVQSEVASLPGS